MTRNRLHIPNDPLELVCDVLRKLAYLNIEECNGNFQRLVVGRIFETGQRLEDLTVGQLTELMQQASDDFNRDWQNVKAQGMAAGHDASKTQET